MARSSEYNAHRALAMGARQPKPTRPRPVQARSKYTVGAMLHRMVPLGWAALAIAVGRWPC